MKYYPPQNYKQVTTKRKKSRKTGDSLSYFSLTVSRAENAEKQQVVHHQAGQVAIPLQVDSIDIATTTPPLPADDGPVMLMDGTWGGYIIDTIDNFLHGPLDDVDEDLRVKEPVAIAYETRTTMVV
jgi:hypothetical protein